MPAMILDMAKMPWKVCNMEVMERFMNQHRVRIIATSPGENEEVFGVDGNGAVYHREGQGNAVSWAYEALYSYDRDIKSILPSLLIEHEALKAMRASRC